MQKDLDIVFPLGKRFNKDPSVGKRGWWYRRNNPRAEPIKNESLEKKKKRDGKKRKFSGEGKEETSCCQVYSQIRPVLRRDPIKRRHRNGKTTQGRTSDHKEHSGDGSPKNNSLENLLTTQRIMNRGGFRTHTTARSKSPPFGSSCALKYSEEVARGGVTEALPFQGVLWERGMT